METITVTVKTADGTFKKTIDNVPLDMLIRDFMDEAQERANLATVPCSLFLDKTNQALRDSDTFQSAGIQSGSLLILTPIPEGG